jgi:hypothetical protein
VSNELITRLSADLEPTPRGVVVRRLVGGLLGGVVVSSALTAAVLGLRPDLVSAAGQWMFWVKFGYTFALAVLAIWACERLTRPAGAARDRLPWLLAPVVLLSALAVWRLAQAQPPARAAMIMGHSASVCPWLILALSVPPLLGLIWAVRGLAPTRLRLAGWVLGLAAGAAGATAYALHCDEMAAPFLMTWYSLGVIGAGLFGWLFAPRLLRW